MLILRITGWVLGFIGITGTLLPFFKYDDYWIRGWDYPRVQLAIMLGVAVVCMVIGNGPGKLNYRWMITGICVLALIYQVFRILPYTQAWSKQVLTAEPSNLRDDNIKLLMSNVLQSNEEYDKLFALIRENEPDIILTLESNEAWQKELDGELSEDYPYGVKVPMENRYGMHLYSQLELQEDEVMHLISDSIPSIFTKVKLESGNWIDLYCVHPPPPSPTEEAASTGRDAELALVGKMVDERGNNTTIVAGDLNDVAWSHSTRLFQRLSGLLDPRRGRGFYATFHADYWFARWPLDHVFHSDDFQLVQLERLPHIGSDHFPVLVELRYVPEESHRMEGPVEKESDREEADSTIQHAKEGKNDVLLVQEEEEQ